MQFGTDGCTLDEKGMLMIIVQHCSFCGAASALNLEYTLPNVSRKLSLLHVWQKNACSGSKEMAKSFAAHRTAMVVFLSSTGMLEELSKRLNEGGYEPDTPAASVYRATWEDEKSFVCTVATLAQTARENNITKTALMIIGDVVAHPQYDRSKLYDPRIYWSFRNRFVGR